MGKSFEDKMMDLIKHCVEVCYDNVKEVENVEKVFIMLWKERTIGSGMYSYQISQQLVKKHKISEYASDMMSITLDELQLNSDKLEILFKEEGREFPTVFKIIYFPQTSKLSQKMEYEMITEKTGEFISTYFDEWVANNIGE